MLDGVDGLPEGPDHFRHVTFATLASFDLVFADPPYGKGLGERALHSARQGGWLTPGALCVVEEVASAPFDPGPHFVVADERSYGETVIRFLEIR